MAKKAIVMGATSGIGKEVAKLLAAKGWQVGIAGRRIERLQALISQGGITCYQQIDVTSPDAPAQLLELIDKLGGMDLYFHSSGIGWQNNTLDIEKELKTLETNGLGFTRMVDTAFNWFATHHPVAHCQSTHVSLGAIGQPFRNAPFHAAFASYQSAEKGIHVLPTERIQLKRLADSVILATNAQVRQRNSAVN